jgi:hypothetical protein
LRYFAKCIFKLLEEVLNLDLYLKQNRNDYNLGAGDWTSTKKVGEIVKAAINTELNK